MEITQFLVKEVHEIIERLDDRYDQCTLHIFCEGNEHHTIKLVGVRGAFANMVGKTSCT